MLILVDFSGADPGFQVRGGALKKIAPSGGRRENIWGISCEKSRFYAKKIIFFPILGGARAECARAPPWIRPCFWWPSWIADPYTNSNIERTIQCLQTIRRGGNCFNGNYDPEYCLSQIRRGFALGFVNYKKMVHSTRSRKWKSLPVACPWSVVLSGYSGFLHH